MSIYLGILVSVLLGMATFVFLDWGEHEPLEPGLFTYAGRRFRRLGTDKSR